MQTNRTFFTASPHLAALLLGSRRGDGRLNVLALLGGRQPRPEAEGIHPQLARPAARMVEVLVLLVLDFLVRLLQGLALGAGKLLRRFADQLPVEMVLKLGDRRALAGHDL